MKKSTYSAILIALFATFASINLISCKKEVTCGSAVADLIINGLTLSMSTPQTGFPVSLSTVVQNMKDVRTNCTEGGGTTETGDANESDTGLVFEVQDPVDGSYDYVGGIDESTPSIDEGQSVSFNRQVTFNRPGTYRVKGVADNKTKVAERSETNNTKYMNFGTRSKMANGKIVSDSLIVVTAAPNYRYNPNQPAITIGKATMIRSK